MKNAPISFILRRYRRSRHIRLSIKHDGHVLVTAPLRASKNIIEKFVAEHATWIQEHLIQIKSEVTHHVPDHIGQANYHTCAARAKKIITERLQYFNKHYNFIYRKVTIRNQQTRWGSCSSKGNLNFRYTLLFLPLYLVDYVVVHELCHLKEMNHSARFWSLVRETIPNYRACRQELRKVRFGGRLD